MWQHRRMLNRQGFLFYFTIDIPRRLSYKIAEISLHSSSGSKSYKAYANSAFFANELSIKNLLNSLLRYDLSFYRLSLTSSLKCSAYLSYCLFLTAWENQQARYLRYLDCLQSERSIFAIFLPTLRRFIQQKLLLRMYYMPLKRKPKASTKNKFYYLNFYPNFYLRSTASVYLLGSYGIFWAFLGLLDVIDIQSSVFLVQCMIDSWRSLKFWAQDSLSSSLTSSASSGIAINLNGYVVLMKSLRSARVARVFWFRSIILSKNLRKFSSRNEEEPIFFIKMGMGLSVAYSRACKYSLQFAVFFLRQGWKPKMISQIQVPNEQISLFSFGRNRLDFNFYGGMQEIVPFLVVLSLHSAYISETPKSHNLNTFPLLSMLTGLMSSCTMPASKSVISPLLN